MADLTTPWSGSEPQATTRPSHRSLLGVAGLLAMLTVIHDLDHIRQGRTLPAALYVVAVGALASLAVTITVLVKYPALAKPVAIAQGAATVAGVGLVHAAPQWSWWTDAYSAARADAASWAIVVAMMAAGAALAVLALSDRGFTTPPPARAAARSSSAPKM